MTHSFDTLIDLVKDVVESFYGEPRFCVLVVTKLTVPSSVRRPVGCDGLDVHSSFGEDELTREALEAGLMAMDDPDAVRHRGERTVS
jgi:hypothetical protein